MPVDYAQRRRVAVAVAITAIAAPAAFLLGGDDEPTVVSTPRVGSVVAGTVDGASQQDAAAPVTTDGRTETPQATDPMGTAPAAFLESSESAPVDDPATIAIPRLPDSVVGTATFSRSITDVTKCQVSPEVGAPFQAAITITNLDNSRSVRCYNSVGGVDPDDSIVLHADAFSQIADLTDAPVPVALSW